MPDIFISYTQDDEKFAQFLYHHLLQEDLTPFLASMSLTSGQRWSPEILDSLRRSTWVLCLASRAACASPWVLQEMGVAIGAQKKLIPIIWDMPPEQLPGWMREYQPLSLIGATPEKIKQDIGRIAEVIKAEKRNALLIGGLLVAGLIFLSRG